METITGLLHLKISVKEEEPHSGVMELLRILRPKWRTEDIKTKVFTEGITNQLMGCYTGCLRSSDDVVLVRVYGNMTDLYLDRHKEMDMFQILHEHGCGPKLYCSFDNGICYEFLHGMVLDGPLLRQPDIYRLIAGEMAKIHSIKPRTSSPPQVVLWTKMSQFLQLVQESENETPMLRSLCVPGAASVEALRSEMNELKRHLGHVYSPTVLCHNDLLTKNIIFNDTKGSVKFIDYEYADFNYQAFDIANHFNEFAGVTTIDYGLYPSVALQLDWLTSYLRSSRSITGKGSAVSEQDAKNLYVTVCKFSLASHFFWGLWAILQARYSTINFDFIKYAHARFKRYFDKKEEYFGM
ncbi:ethanolamine kinase 1-like [Alosa sapidissima]|uniref:ethanolamine kinase 1-like n=1 Tax=Alosa sapidissima TaxID=34773 RepID=UPI001C0961CA|nr:ethanolamine kinase 1-like [Alosa sapidissima]